MALAVLLLAALLGLQVALGQVQLPTTDASNPAAAAQEGQTPTDPTALGPRTPPDTPAMRTTPMTASPSMRAAQARAAELQAAQGTAAAAEAAEAVAPQPTQPTPSSSAAGASLRSIGQRVAAAQQQQPRQQQPPNSRAATTTAAAAAGEAAPPPPACFVVSSYWPFKECKGVREREVCNRGWGAWESEEVCCAPGVGFPEGCTQRPDECWVVENWNSRTCRQDQRKCLQGFGVWPSEEACCAPGAEFEAGCAEVEPAPEPCWVVDTYFPARLCRESNTLCRPETGVKTFRSQQECCAPGKAFSEGCSPRPPQTPCYIKEDQWPVQSCAKSDDVAVCHRGWGTYTSKEICCSPNVAFADGCTPEVATAAGP